MQNKNLKKGIKMEKILDELLEVADGNRGILENENEDGLSEYEDGYYEGYSRAIEDMRRKINNQ